VPDYQLYAHYEENRQHQAALLPVSNPTVKRVSEKHPGPENGNVDRNYSQTGREATPWFKAGLERKAFTPLPNPCSQPYKPLLSVQNRRNRRKRGEVQGGGKDVRQ